MLEASVSKLEIFQRALVCRFAQRHDSINGKLLGLCVVFRANEEDRYSNQLFEDWCADLGLSDDERQQAIVIILERTSKGAANFPHHTTDETLRGVKIALALLKKDGESDVQATRLAEANRLVYVDLIAELLASSDPGPEGVAQSIATHVQQDFVTHLFHECCKHGGADPLELANIWLKSALRKASREAGFGEAWSILHGIHTAYTGLRDRDDAQVEIRREMRALAKRMLIIEMVKLTRGRGEWARMRSDRVKHAGVYARKILGGEERLACIALLDQELSRGTLCGGFVGTTLQALSSYKFLYESEDYEAQLKNWPNDKFAELGKRAIAQAETLCRYGIAAALAGMLGMIDAQASLASLAEKAGQPVRVDLTSV